MTRQWMLMEADQAPYRARIASAGRHLPLTHLPTAELMATTRHRTGIDLERLTGIQDRRVSVGDEDSRTLATAAAQNCLRRAGADAESLDVVISCSITKYSGGLTQWVEPTMSLAVAQAIGAGRAVTFDVSNACAGMLTGVMVLNNWIRQGTVARGLVVSGEYDIDWVITHQTSARAIRKGMAQVTEALGDAPRHDAVITVDRYGNTASTTHTVALVEELRAARIKPGERVALVALASGLEIGVVLFEADEGLLAGYGHDH